MEYSDWVESNGRVWLHDSMTALGQFAYVNPIMRAHHWYNGKKKRCYKCALKRHASKQKKQKNTKKRKRNQNQIDKDAENEITNTTSKRIHKRQKN